MPILNFETSEERRGRCPSWWPSSEPTARARDFQEWESRRAAGVVQI